MRKWRILLVVFAVFCFSACETDPGPTAVTLRNDCGFPIEVNFTVLDDLPSAYYRLEPFWSFSFENIEAGYILIRSDRGHFKSGLFAVDDSVTFSIVWNPATGFLIFYEE